MQIFAGVPPGEGASLRQRRVVVENGRFSLLSFTVFRTFYIHGHWPHDSFHMMRLLMTLVIFRGHYTVSRQISEKRCVIRQKLL